MKQEELIKKAYLMQPLCLALVGDAVESLWLREYFSKTTELKVNAITRNVNKIVNAHAQAESLKMIECDLTDLERDICKRARNTHTHSTAKNYSVIDYRYATAFEALLGFWRMSGQDEKIEKVMQKIIKAFNE